MTLDSLVLNDQPWRDRLASRDEVLLRDIVEQHQSMVFSIAWHAIGSAPVAEEIAQDVFLQLFRNLDTIESEEHLRFWLRRVTTNRVIDESRRRKPVAVSLEDADVAAAELPAPDPILRRRLRLLVRTLPVQQRLVVTLRYQEELEAREIAEVLDMPLNTVRSHLRRAIASLRIALDGEGVSDES